MPINAGYEYFEAEKVYLQAQTLDERISALEEMIRKAPKHKSSENFVAELKTRLKKFLEKKEKQKKSGKTSKKGIKKEGFQFVLLGLPNSGKSSLLKKLTNAHPIISPHPFSTRFPELGTFDFQGIKAQIIDLPSIGSEFFDIGIVNTANSLLIVLDSPSDLAKVAPYISRATKNQIILISKSDLLSSEQLRKLEATLKSKYKDALPISIIDNYNIEKLKSLMLSRMNIVRIYTKEPGKPSTKEPIVLPVGATVKHVAEKILKGFSAKIKETRLTGPSSKFPNQKVGLSHVLKDLDIVEFHTK